jgi:hypothetical protein
LSPDGSCLFATVEDGDAEDDDTSAGDEWAAFDRRNSRSSGPQY